MKIAQGIAVLALSALSIGALAQSGFDSGSNGSYGPIYVTIPALTVASPAPPAGPLSGTIAAFSMGNENPMAGSNRVIRFHAANPLGCTATGGIPAGTFANAIALIQRGTCGFSEKILNAQAAGATTVYLFNNSTEIPVTLSAGTSAIPSAFLSQVDGEALRDFIVANGSTQILINTLVRPNSATLTLQVPPDGIFHATDIYIQNPATLRFACNAKNTPVYLLSASRAIISGTIDASAPNVPPTSSPFTSIPGCGGFAGGAGGLTGSPPGDGYGPGGGKGDPVNPGDGSFGTAGAGSLAGSVYGGSLNIPLIGGSGAGGSASVQGAGGGGALLIASNANILITTNGIISASGGCGLSNTGFCIARRGSGGAIRLIAPKVEGSGELRVRQGGFGDLGYGRIRIDTIDRTGFQINMGTGPRSLGSLMQVFPPNVPELHIVNVAGTAIPVGSGPVNVLLPIGSPATQGITLRGIGFTGNVPVRVVLTPDSGPSITVDGTLAMGGQNSAEVTLQAQVPANVTMNVSAWVRNP